MAVLTSRYTMDARNPAARREIAALADLVGAVRLPQRRTPAGSGTKVVTDLLLCAAANPAANPAPPPGSRPRLISLDGAQVPVNDTSSAIPTTCSANCTR